MFGFLHSDLPASGCVFYPGAIPPPLEQLSGLREPVVCRPAPPAAHQVWVANVTHPSWGDAQIACLRAFPPAPAEIIDHSLALSEEEKARARRGHAAVSVHVQAQQKHLLRDRKRLLFWLRALMQSDGAIATDNASTMFWSEAMLEDELAHDADLDVESLYTIHAVQAPADQTRVDWLHTHGLEALRAFDIDVLQPSRTFVSNCADPLRALAFAALEGAVGADTPRFPLAFPGGDVRLVPVDRFHAEASEEHRRLRDADPVHSGRRVVLCEPAGGLFGRWRSRPAPSRFLAHLEDQGFVVNFSTAATELMAVRAAQTLGVFSSVKEEFGSLELPALVKLGFEIDGGSPTEREHLWFEVHRVLGDRVDATLTNAPHRVSSLSAGQRGEFGLDRLTDWTILSPEGQMTPRNVSAARRLRSTRAIWQVRLDAAKDGRT
jgi:hypothetical protein